MSGVIDKATNLLIKGQPGLKQHALSGNLKGWFAIDVRGSGGGRGVIRIVYRYENNGQSVKTFQEATSVVIKQIYDYH